MSSSKNVHPHSRYEISIQADAEDLQAAIDNPPAQSLTLRPTKPPKTEAITKLMQNLSSHPKQQVPSKPPASDLRRIGLNMMRLQNKRFSLTKNIYNIALGELDSRENYLSTLNEEITQLKDRIRLLEEEQTERIMSRTIETPAHPHTAWSESHEQERSRTIERRSLAGRLISRLDTPDTGRKSRKFSKNKEDASTYFKWKPQIDDHEVTELELVSKEMKNNSTRKKNPEEKARAMSSYRVKQKPAKQASLDYPAEVKKEAIVEKEELAESKQTPIVFEDIQVFKHYVPEWQIQSVTDDFRDKITKKLQIPPNFPPELPSTFGNLTEYEQQAPAIYSIFGVNLDRMKEKVIVRKFKNGVYYQLTADKNIVWYFNGTFYFGNWDTDLPSEGQKNGFGFQFVPQKYLYLGEFKDGARHGKGTIKIFSANPNKQDEFMCYDGQWENGKPHGQGKHIDQKGTKYIGKFVAGEKTGSTVMLSKDGLFYEGEVVRGVKHGTGFQKLVNGDTYSGGFFEGKFQGKGSYKWKNGSSYEGLFVKGKRQGHGVWKSYTGDQFEGEYLADAKHGWGKFQWANGQIYEGEFRNDIRHGQGTYRHPSGKEGKFLWKDGQIEHRITLKQAKQSDESQD